MDPLAAFLLGLIVGVISLLVLAAVVGDLIK